MFMLQKMHALAVGGEAEAPYTANAVDLDGTNDYLTRGADLTGNTDSSLGILSMWVRIDGGNATNRQLIADDSLFVSILLNSSNQFAFDLWGPSEQRLRLNSTTTYTAGATWRHLLASWSTNFTAGNKLHHLYVNDVSDKSVSDSYNAGVIDYTRGNWGVGGQVSGSQKFNGCMSEVYFAPGQFLDFSVQANRRKFISATGKPVSLGADGSLPTGTAPRVYLNNPAASFGTNKGTGGNFTITGTLDTASTSPSD